MTQTYLDLWQPNLLKVFAVIPQTDKQASRKKPNFFNFYNAVGRLDATYQDAKTSLYLNNCSNARCVSKNGGFIRRCQIRHLHLPLHPRPLLNRQNHFVLLTKDYYFLPKLPRSDSAGIDLTQRPENLNLATGHRL